jgi:hypothetical protein
MVVCAFGGGYEGRLCWLDEFASAKPDQTCASILFLVGFASSCLLAMTSLAMTSPSMVVLRLAVLPWKQFACMAELVSTVIARCAEVVELYRCVAPKQSAV